MKEFGRVVSAVIIPSGMVLAGLIYATNNPGMSASNALATILLTTIVPIAILFGLLNIFERNNW